MTRNRFKKRSIRKRSFLLFELVISLALITLCLFPLIKPHIHMRKTERQQLIEMQIHHEIQVTFCEIKELLYEHQFSWEELNTGITGTLKPVALTIGKGKTVPYQRRYEIVHYAKTPKPSFQKKGMVIGIDISLSSGSKECKLKRILYLEQETEKKA